MKKPSLPAKKKPNDDLSPEERSEMIRQATGTSSDALQNRLLGQAYRPVLAGIQEEEHKKRARRAVVEGLMGIAPEDGPEALLAVQMLTRHNTAMECMRRAMYPKVSAQGRDSYLKHAVKFMSLYPQQLGALDKHRGKGQQKMTVEYVNVEAGGQAIVGNVKTAAEAKPAKQPVVRKRTR